MINERPLAPREQVAPVKPQRPKTADSASDRLNGLANRLLSFTNTLLLSGSDEELYKNILETAAELTSACKGSIMLVDKNGEHIHIVHTKGMTAELARDARGEVGSGIAGEVAKSGKPLLVKDVEKDLRIARENRPRYQSKSMVSIPFKLNEKVLGILNLSDKWNLAPFSETDLYLLTSFCTLASLMIERTQVSEEVRRFEQLSLTDPLTGTYNRRFLNSRIEEEVNRSLHQGLEFTVLFIDLGHFKGFNDRFGHLVGDEALRTTASVIKSAMRGMDIVARFGGEEFCVLLPGASKRLALLVAERVREGIELQRCPGDGYMDGCLTASIGVASFPEDGTTLTTLLNASDKALYQAKSGGRNRVVASQPAQPMPKNHLPIPWATVDVINTCEEAAQPA